MMFVFKERRWKLKKGTVQDQDIRKISYSAAVKEKRKRICRALLGVENADSHLADIAQNQDIEEQTYQIFRKWKQSKRRTFVTYQALAQALLDRTVNLDQVVTDFCTAIQGGEENWRLLSGNCSSLFRCSFLVWHCCLFVMAVKFDLSPLLSAFSNLQYRQLDCEQSLFFFRFSGSNARAQERRSRETRETGNSLISYTSLRQTPGALSI